MSSATIMGVYQVIFGFSVGSRKEIKVTRDFAGLSSETQNSILSESKEIMIGGFFT